MSHRVRVQVEGFQQPTTSGFPALGIAKDWLSETEIGSSTTKADRAVLISASISGSGSLAINLAALTGPGGETISLDLVHLIMMRSTTSGATLSVEPGASDGWDGFGSSGYSIVFGKGAFLWHVETGFPVASDKKNIKIDNDALTAATVEILIIGQD